MAHLEQYGTATPALMHLPQLDMRCPTASSLAAAVRDGGEVISGGQVAAMPASAKDSDLEGGLPVRAQLVHCISLIVLLQI